MGKKLIWPVLTVLSFLLGTTLSNIYDDKIASQPQLFGTNSSSKVFDAETDTHKITSKEKPKTSLVGKAFNISEVSRKLAKIKNYSSLNYVDLETMADIYNVLKDIPHDQIISIIDELPKDEGNQVAMYAIKYLVGKYAEEDPTGILDYMQTSQISTPHKVAAISTIYATWAKADPEAAFQGFLDDNVSYRNDFLKNATLVELLGVIATQDLDLAVNKLIFLYENDRPINMAIAGVTTNFSESYQFEDLINKLTPLNDESLINDSVVMWASKEPEQASLWLAGYQNDNATGELANNLYTQWARSDFKKAADWYLGQSTDSKQQAINTIIDRTYFTNPQETLDWLTKQPNIDLDVSLSNLLKHSAFSNPNFANDNMGLISNENAKHKVALSIYNSYKHQNKKLAETYLKNSPYREQIEKKLEMINKYRNTLN